LRRQRAERGEICLTVCVPEVQLVERLIAAGLVREADYDNRRKIGTALEVVVWNWCGVTRDDMKI
jgi:hypothetical protein